MKNRYTKDQRVKAEIFPFHIFMVTFVTVGVFTTIQMRIIGEYIDYTKIAPIHAIALPALWLLAAAIFTLLTRYQIRSRYQKPIENLAKAARKVASGDFSVYVASRHTPDKVDYLDVLFMDFNKMVEELGCIETLKTDFFSNVSHEIKTPIAVIQNNAELLQNGAGTEAQRHEYTTAILQATHRLSGLITNMLKLNKLEKQVIKPVPEPFDVSAQICECALQFEDLWEKKNISFDADIEERVIINADAGLLELVWTNLLSNALKFTPDGGSVRITQTSDRDWITVSVSDTGCGMDENTLKRIFDKFYQGDTSHATEGNGLGLALVQRIMQLSDGTIAVKSDPGKGSVFTVTLPVAGKQEERA
ncbi:MAG: HAMP domain-containing sensor histidine kinase [Clostridiales bacterium]|nr:HAMP domain-containing sensor histidine kinase [Clostridiales bacterium]